HLSGNELGAPNGENHRRHTNQNWQLASSFFLMLVAKRLRDGIRRGEISAGFESGRGRTFDWAAVTGWTKARSRWTRSSRLASRTSHRNWCGHRVFWESSTCSKWPSTAVATGSI